MFALRRFRALASASLALLLVAGAASALAQGQPDDSAEYPYRVTVANVIRQVDPTPSPTPTAPPTSTATPDPGAELPHHVVQEGETLASIAAQYGTASTTLALLNGLDRAAPLVAGTDLLIAPPPPGELPCRDLLVPLNQFHALGDDCVPESIVPVPDPYNYGGQEVAAVIIDPLMRMLDDASAAGHDVSVVSAYRSWQVQEVTFQYWVDVLGLEEAAKVSARPGHSEHQLGTTVDIASPAVGYELIEEFGETPEGLWLAEHAADYGFVMSYPPDDIAVTGYEYEPWHFRYVGPDVTDEVTTTGDTLTQVLMRRFVMRAAAEE